MDALLREQYARILDALPANPWPVLAQSGFLDLLRPEETGLGLEALFVVALETGRRADPPNVVETMVARLADPGAIAVEDAEARLAAGGIDPSLARALAAAAAAAQMVGAMEAMLELTIDYARTRRQFGQAIGKFQALQQQLALAAEEAEAARISAQAALTGIAESIDIQRVAVAKIRAGMAAQTISAVAHAVHGAIGISAEYPLHHFTRRLHRWRLAHGGEGWWAGRLGRWLIARDVDLITAIRDLSGQPSSRP